MVPEIIEKIKDQKYVEALVNLVGLMYYLHENVRNYSGDEIFSVTLAHDALSDTLMEMNNIDKASDSFNYIAEYCAHLAILRLQEVLGDKVAGRAAKSLSLGLETIISLNKKRGDQDKRSSNENFLL
jgi:hypothetical protein